MLLVCPGLPHARDRLDPDLVHSFRQGYTEGIGEAQESCVDFADSDGLWAFSRLVNPDSLQDCYHFFTLSRSLLPGKETDARANSLKSQDDFIKSSQIILQYDASHEEVARSEDEYFSCTGPERLALARYLTMIAELNPHFVADKHLWKWISMYLNDRDTYMFPTVHALGKRKRKFSESTIDSSS